MRGIYAGVIAALFLSHVLFPLFSMNKTILPSVDYTVETPDGTVDGESFRVKMEDGEIVKLSAFDYIKGVVYAEMPAEYSTEALKAQAVAAYTFALYRKQQNKDKDYDITDSTSPDQAYMTEEEFKKREGSNYSAYSKKIGDAVKSVLGKVITYDGQIALSIYHNISGGKTESAELLWGGSYPYLQPVESVGDLLCPEYSSEKTISSDEFKAKAEKLGAKLSGEANEWLGEIKNSESGTVLSLEIGDKAFTGAELREAFGLKSANFDVSCKDGNFVFSVRGNGHGVGMSQYGAQFMALQGSDYVEILHWYYKGCEIG